MRELSKVNYVILILFLLSPLFAHIFESFFVTKNILFYYQIFFELYGFIYIFLAYVNKLKLKIPKATYYLIAYVLYRFIWSFDNGNFERRGFLNILLNNVFLTTVFTIIIIYNTKFTDKFINLSLIIIKFTIIIATIISLIQVLNPAFMAANFYKDIFINKYSIYEIRRQSIFGYIPNGMGLSYIPLLSIFIGAYSYLKKKNLTLFLFLGAISAVLSNFRYVMIGFLLLTLQISIYDKKKYQKLFKYILIMLLLTFIGYHVLTYFDYNIMSWYRNRLFKEGSIKETTRYKAIGNFLIFFPKYMWFGDGVGMTNAIKMASAAVGSSQIHVGYLSHLVYWGIVGSFFLFGFWFQVIYKFLKNAQKTQYWGSFFAFLTFLWANATLVHFSIFHYGLIFAFVFDKYFQDKYIEGYRERNLHVEI